jgi:hypothetical protein
VNISDLASLASAVFAFFALLLSFWSIRKTNKFGEITNQLNRLWIEREQADVISAKQADLSASIINVANNQYRLKVFNRGKGIARNVRLIDLSEYSSVLIADDIERKFPVPTIEQYQSVELTAAVTFGSSSHIPIKLIWDDETGQNREKELTPVV